MSDAAKETIFKGINSFYIEIYDADSYLIWVNNENTSFIDIVKKNLHMAES